MESTIEKLNQNRLMELTEQDYENIANNTELKTLFMSKVKEGHQFNFEDASNVFDEEDFLNPEYITTILDIFKEQMPDDYVEIFFASEEELKDQFNEDTLPILLEYLDKNLDYALNILRNSEQKYRRIKNKKLIDAIISNKLENHYGSIELNPPTEEFEQLLIDALDRITYKSIYTLTPAILKKCELTNNLAAAAVALKGDDPEEEKIIMAAIENGTLKYDDLRDPFLSNHESDIRILRSKIRTASWKHIDSKEFERPEVIAMLIEEIERNHELANEWSITSNCDEHPELVITVLKYWSPDKTKSMAKYGDSMINKAFQTHRKEVIDAIIYNLEHNLDHIDEVLEAFVEGSRYSNEIIRAIIEDPIFFQYMIPKIKIETILNHFICHSYDDGQSKYYIKEEIYKLLSNTQIILSEVPKNFDYSVDYPDNVWLALIPLLNEKELIPSKIDIDRFKDRLIVFDCILTRLKELRSNSYNSYLEYWQGPTTDTLIELVCSPDNPLNLSTTQKFRILPAAKMQNKQYILEIIKQEPVISTETLKVVLPIILNLEDLERVKTILPILFPKIELNDGTINFLSSQAADVYGTLKNSKDGEINISKQYILFYEYLEEFLKTQKDIPLKLTSHFEKEIADIATYNNPDNLVNNPNLFKTNGLAPHHFVEYIKECQAKNLPIDLKLLKLAAKTSVSKQPYDYENITFSDDQETYEILYELLNTSSKDSIERKVIDKWVQDKLTYQFFDCQTEGNKIQFMTQLIGYSEYIDKIVEVIDPKNIPQSVVLSSTLIQTLILGYENDEQNEKVHQTIINLLENNKITQYKPDWHFGTFLTLVDNPIFVEYMKKSCLTNIGSHLQHVDALLSNPNYKQATLEALYANEYLGTNYTIIELVDKYPEIKQYVKKSLENNENLWLDFNKKYFDPELLPAFLKNHSIAKVITFIVHQQTLNLITPEIYQIIKTSFLNTYPEYNKESFDILEKFYGLELLLLLEAENLLSLLKKDKDVVQKFTEIFKERKLDENIITSISDSFRQNYFNIENPHIINFYTNTLEKIQRGITEEEIQEVINILIDYIPSNLEEEIKATGNELLLNTYKANKLDFITMLIHELINNQNTYAGVFNKITNNLIVQKRNEYRSTQDIYRDTNLKYELDTKSLHNALFNYLAKNNPNELLDLIEYTEYDTDINWKTIQFLSGKTDRLTQEEIPAIKRNIPKLKAAIIDRIFILNEKDNQPKKRSYWSWYDQEEPKKFPNLPRRYEYLLDIPEFARQVKKIPIYPAKKKPIENIGNINIAVFEQLAKDEEKYNALMALLNKYRFLEWENLFEPTVKKLAIGEDEINLYNFINAFSKIYDNEKKIILRERKRLIDIMVEEMKRAGKTQEEIDDYIRIKENEPINVQITAYKILKYSTIYSSIANYYKIILGMEDFELVKRNDGPNSSHRSPEDRLTKATEMQLQMMELDKVTVPSFIYEHELKSGENKKLAVTVGNRADSRNLTHGERTGACMRAYGHADSLFEFCNTDPRGFHITFTDPETNEYVSRVSCFRNGNTVFLNQLRNSVSAKYTTEDVIEACFAVAQQLIELSKNSEMPIENVVASTGYALSGYPTQQLSEYNIGAGVYTGYKDVNNYSVVIATTGENGKAVPLKLDGENQPIYEPVRLMPREYVSPNITESVKIQLQRITSIRECLENKESPDYYKTIDFDYELIDSEYLHVIIGQDWYVALDVNGNITHDIAVQNEYSIEELNEALATMNKIKEDKLKLGGFTNGI